MLPARPAVHVTNLVVACAGGVCVWDNGNGILSPKYKYNKLYDGLA